MDLLNDYLTFVNDLIVGQDNSDPVKQVLSSTDTMDACNSVISDMVNKNSQIVDQSVYVHKKIVVDCGSKPLYDPSIDNFYLKYGGEQYDFFGNEIEDSGCPRWGCCYDVNQSSKVSLSAINKSILQKSEEMYNKVTEKIKQNITITAASSQKPLKVINDATVSAKNDAIEKINQILNQITDVDIHQDQNIIFRSVTPLKCINKCTEPPTAGKIKQSLNVEIASQNITSSIFESIHNNIADLTMETELTFSNVNQTRLTIFGIIFIINVIVIYIMIYVIIFIVLKAIEAEGGDEIEAAQPFGFSFRDHIKEHIISICVLIILFIIYKVILCLWRSRSSKIGTFKCLI
jgi:hypothetical protein